LVIDEMMKDETSKFKVSPRKQNNLHKLHMPTDKLARNGSQYSSAEGTLRGSTMLVTDGKFT
jgi:hypothetical protein